MNMKIENIIKTLDKLISKRNLSFVQSNALKMIFLACALDSSIANAKQAIYTEKEVDQKIDLILSENESNLKSLSNWENWRNFENWGNGTF